MRTIVIDGETYVKAADVRQFLLDDADRLKEYGFVNDSLAVKSAANAVLYLTKN